MTFAPDAVSEVNALVPPIAPVIVTVPPVPPFRVRFCVPLIVLETEMFAPAAAPLVVFAITSLAKVTGPVQLMAPPLVVRLPFKLIPPV